MVQTPRRIADRGDRKPDREIEERRNNRKYVRVISYCPVRIIHVICATALLSTIYVWLQLV